MRIKVTKDEVYVENIGSEVEWTIEEPDGFLVDLHHEDVYLGLVERIAVLRSLLKKNIMK